MMILRSEMREEVRERRRRRNRGGGDDVSPPERMRDYEERVTYKTITRTEFQRRRASFESREEAEGDGTGRIVGLTKKARSSDDLAGKREEDPYRIRFQEREMTEKLEDIHRMIVDMQEMTKQLKDRNYSEEERLEGKLRVEALGMIAPTEADNSGRHEKPLLISGPALTVKPVRYRSTIVIVIGSQWQRFKEEIELKVDSRFLTADGFEEWQ